MLDMAQFTRTLFSWV